MSGFISHNGTVIRHNNLGVSINGVEIPYPKGVCGNLVTLVDGQLFVDGYELRKGKWKITFRSLFYKFFW